MNRNHIRSDSARCSILNNTHNGVGRAGIAKPIISKPSNKDYGIGYSGHYGPSLNSNHHGLGGSGILI
jgi:hypothetical protein